MMTCVLCRYETEPGANIVAGSQGRCVCLRCYVSETGSSRPVPKALQRDLLSAIAEFDGA